MKILWSEFGSQVFSLVSSSFLRFVGLFLILSVVEEWCETRMWETHPIYNCPGTS